MSSLIFHTEESQVLVATDTLATSPNGQPFMFTTKSFIVPHLRMIIAGTGAGGFAGRWFVQVNDRMIVRGIDNLDFHTPDNLAARWREYKLEFPDFDNLTTIYHFGFSEKSGIIRTYVYRSENNFRSESLGYGCGVKPECKVSANYQLPQDILPMMLEQRKTQAAQPKEERIYIGGEIQITHLTEHGFNCYTLSKFDDYDSNEQSIYNNFR